VVRLIHAVEVVAARGSGQDRAFVNECDDGFVIVLADGAGGTGNGADAAQAIIDAVRTVGTAQHDWCALLAALDRDGSRLGHGQSTAVILSITATGMSGASVGDSGAWLINGSDVLDLTDGQARKPLVGSGCEPFRIEPTRLGSVILLVASDGLFRYANRHDIARTAVGVDLSAAARALVDLVRLPSGALQDDLSVVLCRERP
jgi:serine/threonine protein phosphatase PrpC